MGNCHTQKKSTQVVPIAPGELDSIDPVSVKELEPSSPKIGSTGSPRSIRSDRPTLSTKSTKSTLSSESNKSIDSGRDDYPINTVNIDRDDRKNKERPVPMEPAAKPTGKQPTGKKGKRKVRGETKVGNLKLSPLVIPPVNLSELVEEIGSESEHDPTIHSDAVVSYHVDEKSGKRIRRIEITIKKEMTHIKINE